MNDIPTIIPPVVNTHRKDVLKRRALFIGVPFLIVLIGVIYLFMILRVQKNILELSITGPKTLKSGDEVALHIQIKNQHRSKVLQGATLSLKLPEGTRVPSGETITGEKTYDMPIQDVKPGETTTTDLNVQIFGESEGTLEITGTVHASDSVFSGFGGQESKYQVIVDKPNLAVDLDVPKTVESGSTVTYHLQVKNNSSADYKNLSTQFLFPEGFNMTASSEESALEGFWKFGDLAAGATKDLELSGRLEGIANERKDIGVRVGNLDANSNFYSQFLVSEVTVVSTPTISLTQTASKLVVDAGESTTFTIKVKNVGNAPLANLELHAALDPRILNPKSLELSDGAVFRNGDVIWDSTIVDALRVLEPNKELTLNFSAASYENIKTNDDNFVLASHPKIKTLEGTIDGEIVQVKIRTHIGITTSAVALDSQGRPLSEDYNPPLNKQTRYRITWKISNSYNALENARFACTVPVSAHYDKQVSVASGNFVYNTSAKTIIWSIGTMGSATAKKSNNTTTAVFDVLIAPTTPDAGDDIPLVTKCTFSGHDSFVDQEMTFGVEDQLSGSVQDE